MKAFNGRSCQGLKFQDKEYQTSYTMRRPLEARSLSLYSVPKKDRDSLYYTEEGSSNA